jgi:hypothetical protein
VTSTELPGRRSRRRRIGCVVGPIGLVILLAMTVSAAATLGAIWPGVYEYTAPVLCDDGFDDAFVVRDTYRVQPGESSTTFTMYCMNDRGEVVDVGFLRPIAIVATGFTVAVFALLLVSGAVWKIRRNRRAVPAS